MTDSGRDRALSSQISWRIELCNINIVLHRLFSGGSQSSRTYFRGAAKGVSIICVTVKKGNVCTCLSYGTFTLSPTRTIKRWTWSSMNFVAIDSLTSHSLLYSVSYEIHFPALLSFSPGIYVKNPSLQRQSPALYPSHTVSIDTTPHQFKNSCLSQAWHRFPGQGIGIRSPSHLPSTLLLTKHSTTVTHGRRRSIRHKLPPHNGTLHNSRTHRSR